MKYFCHMFLAILMFSSVAMGDHHYSETGNPKSVSRSNRASRNFINWRSASEFKRGRRDSSLAAKARIAGVTYEELLRGYATQLQLERDLKSKYGLSRAQLRGYQGKARVAGYTVTELLRLLKGY